MKNFYHLIIFLLLSACTSRKVIDYQSGKGFSHVDINGEYFLADPNFSGNKKIKNFSQAKKIIKQNNYFGITEEMYCGCQFKKSRIAIDASCGLRPRKNEDRAYRIEFEHIVPFENQVGHTAAWLNGDKECGEKHGRKCASIVFAHMEGDLWNLWPAAGELNADRSNFSFAELTGPRDQYGKCDFKVEDRKVAPRDSVKALIAYTYMYFQKTYAPYLKTNYISSKNE
jgi:deoxyribonuclease-1